MVTIAEIRSRHSSLSLSRWLTRTRWTLAWHLADRPLTYTAIRRLARGRVASEFSENTDLVVEGFPRSANSTTVDHLAAAYPTIDIAHHLHHPAQIHRALRSGTPVVVLVREPVDAILSFLALGHEMAWIDGRAGGSFWLDYSDALSGWQAFYQQVLRVRGDVLIAPFDVVTEELRTLESAVGALIGERPSYTVKNRPTSKTGRGSHPGIHALPTDVRDSIKRELCDELRTELATNDGLRKQLHECKRLHRALLSPESGPVLKRLGESGDV